MSARVAAWLVLLAGLTLALGGSSRADDAPGTPPALAGQSPDEDSAPAPLMEGIEKALAKGVAWLKAQQRDTGSWGNLHGEGRTYTGGWEGYDTPQGPTALALYTLLKCDVTMADPVVKKGFDWLRQRSRMTADAYEVSMNLLAVTATADPFKRSKDSSAAAEKVKIAGEWRKWATELKDRLLALRAPIGWRYWGRRDAAAGGGGPEDLSSTQLAALALLAAERCGISVDPTVWTGIIEFTTAQQEAQGPEHPRAVVARAAAQKPGAPPAPGGGPTTGEGGADRTSPLDHARGFAYIRDTAKDASDRAASGGMTACGVGCLTMARYVLSSRFQKAWKAVDSSAVQRDVYDGLAWLDRNWSPSTNPIGGRSHYHLYYVYCTERAMDLVGGQRLGKHLWYAEMAEKLLPLQDKAGFWDTQSTIANGPVLDTCFALLFLHRATRGGIPFPSVTGGSDVPPVDNR